MRKGWQRVSDLRRQSSRGSNVSPKSCLRRAQPKIELIESPAEARKAESKLNSFAIDHKHAWAGEERIPYGGARIFLMTFGLAISAASPSGVT